MASINKAIVVGNCARDPEVRYLPNGDAVANVTVATSEKWKDKNSGEQKELTEWHRVTFYRRLAEVVGEYLKKGSQVYIEGRLQTRKWTDKDGVERYTTEIIADTMQMLGSRAGGSGRNDNNDDDYNTPPARQQRNPQQPARQNNARPAPPAYDDDHIPFANPYRGRMCLSI